MVRNGGFSPRWPGLKQFLPPTWQLTAIFTTSSKGSNALLWSPWHQAHMWYANIHKHKIKKTKKTKKQRVLRGDNALPLKWKTINPKHIVEGLSYSLKNRKGLKHGTKILK